MSTKLLLVLLLVVLALPVAMAQTSLGGMTPGDTVDKILTKSGAPDSIQAVRGDSEATDYAIMLWPDQNFAVILTPAGNKTFGVVTSSPLVTTSDGLACGQSKDAVVRKLGNPDEVDSVEGMDGLWYWKRGAAFLMDEQDNVAMIFVFSPSTKPNMPKSMSPSQEKDSEHRYMSFRVDGKTKAPIASEISQRLLLKSLLHEVMRVAF